MVNSSSSSSSSSSHNISYFVKYCQIDYKASFLQSSRNFPVLVPKNVASKNILKKMMIRVLMNILKNGGGLWLAYACYKKKCIFV